MKKKLALLLASVMALAIPSQSFAAGASVPNANNAYAVRNGTVLYEKDVLRNEQIYNGDPNGVVNASVDGTDLVLTFNQVGDTVRAGQTMRIQLSNAEFWFKSRTNDIPFSLSTIAGTGEKWFTGTTTGPSTTPEWSGDAAARVIKNDTRTTGITGTSLSSLLSNAGLLDSFRSLSSSVRPENFTFFNGVRLYGTDRAESADRTDPFSVARRAAQIGFGLVLSPNRAAAVLHTSARIASGNVLQTYSSASADYANLSSLGSILSNYEMTFATAFAADATYDKTQGLFFSDGGSTHNGRYYRFPKRADVQIAELENMDGVGSVATADRDTLRPNPTSQNTGSSREIPYKMTVGVWGSDNTQATIEVLPLNNLGVSGNVRQNTYPLNTVDPYQIRIPLVVLTNGSEVTAKIIDSNISGVAIGTTFMVNSTAGVGTTATLGSPGVATGRDRFALSDIIIRENVLRTITDGGVLTIQAPNGYSIDLSEMNVYVGTGTKTGLSLTGAFGSDPSVAAAYGLDKTLALLNYDYIWEYKLDTSAGSSRDRSTVYLYFWPGAIERSSTIPGSINLSGVKLFGEPWLNDGDVTLTLGTLSTNLVNNYGFNNYASSLGVGTSTSAGRIVANGYGLSPRTFPGIDGTSTTNARSLGLTTPMNLVVARRTDWGVTLSSPNPPTLISGRYSSTTQYLADDANHRAATVTAQEVTVNSWWVGRETRFTLDPNVAKFRRIQTTTQTNLQDMPSLGMYLADGLRQKSLYVDTTEILIYNTAIDANKRATFTFIPWISIKPGYTGDVVLTFNNTNSSTVSNEGAITTVIAKAEAPVSVEVSEVVDVKIGYQTFLTGDVTITETGAGRLQKGKKVFVSVSDLISQDVYFANIDFTKDVKFESANNVFAIRNVTNVGSGTGSATFGFHGAQTNNTGISSSNLLLGGGTLSMEIDRPSTGNAPGKITLSNLQVKVNRDVPQSTDPSYKVVVWGDAIGENYGPNRDQFTWPGVVVDYMKVVSSANDATSVLTREVRVTIGERYYVVGGVTKDMDAAAYISEAGATMVPLRFVSEALGIQAEAVIWDDPTKTVTIIHPSRVIQFTSGSDKMMLNGAPVTMHLDGQTRIAEIKGDRMYIPFRALGEAFGVPVHWDEETQTAIFNKKDAVAAAEATE